MYRTDNLSQLLVIYKMTVHMNRTWLDIHHFVWFYDNSYTCDTSHKYLVWKAHYIIALAMEKLWLTTIIGDFSVPYGFTIKIECLLRFMKTMQNLCVCCFFNIINIYTVRTFNPSQFTKNGMDIETIN